MKISVGISIPKNQPLVVFAFENDSASLGSVQRKDLVQDAAVLGFKGKENSAVLVSPKGGSPAKLVIVAGLGSKKNFEPEVLRRAAALAVKKASASSQKAVSFALPGAVNGAAKEAQAIVEGALLANYKFDKYLSDKKDSGVAQVALVVSKKDEAEAKRGAKIGQIYADAVNLTRDLVNEPPSIMTPAEFVKCAEWIAKEAKGSGITIKVFDKKKMEDMGMGALLGVNRGSAEPPALVHMHYKPAGARKKIALVGKGITFDSGGLSLKPAESMETMKMDMAGASSILAVFRALPHLKPAVEIHGIMALTENMPGGKAYKPGDVLKAMNGKTIEVLNTDAEGRIILADALSYAVKQNPDCIIDLATLTGACIIGLGSLVAGIMGNDEKLLKDLQFAGQFSGERLWPLPLLKDYRDGLRSPIADLKNISSIRREGGSIIGGLFLQEFVDGKPWAHLDIAGPAWTDRELPYCKHGGTGFPVRTLLNYLLSL